MSVGADIISGGPTLYTAQRLAVTNALTKLKVNEKLPHIAFWGKITGVNADYLVAVSIASHSTITKRYYFSSDGGVTFARLPAADDWVREKIRTVFSKIPALLFTGLPAHEYRDPNQPVEEPEDKDVDEPEQKGPKPVDPNKRKMTELERLSHTVEAIERATCVAPRGVAYLTPTGDIETNQQFKGLSAFDSKRLESYSLYRASEHAATLARIRAQGLQNCLDFLDRVSDDADKGVWCIQQDDSGQKVTLRHLEWPGFEFCHCTATGAFHRAYVGSGEKNLDVNFML